MQLSIHALQRLPTLPEVVRSACLDPLPPDGPQARPEVESLQSYSRLPPWGGKAGAVCCGSISNERTTAPVRRSVAAIRADPADSPTPSTRITTACVKRCWPNLGDCRPSPWPHRPVSTARCRRSMLSFMPSEPCWATFCLTTSPTFGFTTPLPQMQVMCDRGDPVNLGADFSFPPGGDPHRPVKRPGPRPVAALPNPNQLHRHSLAPELILELAGSPHGHCGWMSL